MSSTKSFHELLENNLKTPEDMANYVSIALEDGDESDFLAALGDVAKLTGFKKLAEDTGLGRESMYKALSKNGNPTLETLMLILSALHLKLGVSPSDSNDQAA